MIESIEKPRESGEKGPTHFRLLPVDAAHGVKHALRLRITRSTRPARTSSFENRPEYRRQSFQIHIGANLLSLKPIETFKPANQCHQFTPWSILHQHFPR